MTVKIGWVFPHDNPNISILNWESMVYRNTNFFSELEFIFGNAVYVHVLEYNRELGTDNFPSLPVKPQAEASGAYRVLEVPAL